MPTHRFRPPRVSSCRGLRPAVLTVAAALLNGCGGLTNYPTIDRLDEAGSVHVSVLSVIPFKEYKADLQPKFALSEAEALAKAIPSAGSFDERILDAIAFRAKVAAGTETAKQTEKVTNVVAEKPSTTTETGSETNTMPGDVSSAKDISAAGARTAAAIESGLPDDRPVDNAPSLQYLAATALFQEVKLLNKYVERAAIAQGDEAEAYIVRMQVTLMPRQRSLGLDAYTNIAFFDGPADVCTRPTTSAPPNAASRPGAALATPAPATATATATVGGAPVDASANAAAGNEYPNIRLDFSNPTSQIIRTLNRSLSPRPAGKVRVLPMFVTDNIESILESRSLDRVRRLTLALAASSGNVGVGADFDALNERLATAIGSELNSTFTIGRLTDNAIRCRFGASATPESGAIGYAMVPQTHNVTVLVVREGPAAMSKPVMNVVASSTFVDAKNGEPLRARSPRVARGDLREAGKRSGLSFCQRDNDDDMLVLGRLVELNDYPEFAEKYRRIRGDNKDAVPAAAAWTEFAAVRLGDSATVAEFPRPQRPPFAAPPAVIDGSANAATIADDGNSAVVTVVGGKALDEVPLLAALEQLPAGTTTAGKIVARSAVRVLDGGGTVQATFPSIAKLAAPDAASADAPTIANLRLRLLTRTAASNDFVRFGGDDSGRYTLTAVPAPDPSPPPVRLSSAAEWMLAQRDGTASLRVTLATPPGVSGNLNAHGAILKSVTSAGGAVVSVSNDGFPIAAAGTFDLAFTNAVPGAVVTLSFAGKDAGGKQYKAAPVLIAIVPVQPPPP